MEYKALPTLAVRPTVRSAVMPDKRLNELLHSGIAEGLLHSKLHIITLIDHLIP